VGAHKRRRGDMPRIAEHGAPAEDIVREAVSSYELFWSILLVELLPLIAGAVIAAIGYNLYLKQSLPVLAHILLVIGLGLLVRNGIIIQFMKLCGKGKIDCYLCLFRLDKDHFWHHPCGNEIPVVQCLLPSYSSGGTCMLAKDQ